MHKSSKSEHGYDERCENGTCYHKSKGLEESEITEEEAEATSECGDATAENTNSHLSVGLSHFVVPLDVCRMHVICGEMHNIIDWESDQNNERNGLSCTKLKTSHVHKGHDCDNNNRYAPYRNSTLNNVPGCVKKNEKGEENGDDDTL